MAGRRFIHALPASAPTAGDGDTCGRRVAPQGRKGNQPRAAIKINFLVQLAQVAIECGAVGRFLVANRHQAECIWAASPLRGSASGVLSFLNANLKIYFSLGGSAGPVASRLYGLDGLPYSSL
jgi:hypothetical protein